MSPDPYNGSYDVSNPQSLNRYAYALNNPLRMVDPSGQDTYDCDADFDEDCYGGGGGGVLPPCPPSASFMHRGFRALDQGCDPGNGGIGVIADPPTPLPDPSDPYGPPPIDEDPYEPFPTIGLDPNNNGCVITARCRGIQTDNLGKAGFQHCDAIVTDPNGVNHSLSGGPDGPLLNAWDSPPSPESWTGTIVYAGASCTAATCMINSTRTYNQNINKPAYNPFTGPNSNTWLKGTAASCGVNLPINTWGSIW